MSSREALANCGSVPSELFKWQESKKAAIVDHEVRLRGAKGSLMILDIRFLRRVPAQPRGAS